MRYRVLVIGIVLAAVAGITGAPATGSTSAGPNHALVEALLFHRSDVPRNWLQPRWDNRSPVPCSIRSTPGSHNQTRRGAGWVEAGDTLIRRVMWSAAETSSAPDKLFHAHVAEFTRCIRGRRATSQPGRLVKAPVSVKIESFYATEQNPSGDIGFELMVVRVGNAVAQYIYRWVQPPYRKSGRDLVRGAVARGVKTLG